MNVHKQTTASSSNYLGDNMVKVSLIVTVDNVISTPDELATNLKAVLNAFIPNGHPEVEVGFVDDQAEPNLD